jgi:diaminopimelate epimerase
MSSPAKGIPFCKASACGNDFLIIDGSFAPEDVAVFSRRICDRHNGIGADGVEWTFAADDVDAEARLFNADGSEAEISGNGTRCVAAWLCAEKPRERVAIRTGAGIKNCILTASDQPRYEFEMEMGAPLVGAELSAGLGASTMRGIPVSMGNPHFVVFAEAFDADWQAKAARLQSDSVFASGVNVEWVMVRGPHEVAAMFYERGVGETQSSGTGSCASAVAAIATGRAFSPVQVHAPGGVQTVRWEGPVFLRGWARLVCQGEFFI